MTMVLGMGFNIPLQKNNQDLIHIGGGDLKSAMLMMIASYAAPARKYFTVYFDL